MIEPTPTPSFLLKASAVAARWSLRLLLMAWLVLGMVWGGLHFLIVPRIAELRPLLEQQASKALGAQVRIGSIVATSNGLIPSFELDTVTLADASGREVLRLPKVLVALSARSVLGLDVEQLYIDSPVLDVRRTADGTIWVAGIALSSDTNPDNAVADWLFSQDELAIVHGTVHWSDALRPAPPLVLTQVDLVLRNDLTTHALRMDATPPAAWGARMSLMGEFKQSLLSRRASHWKDWQGQLYASLPQIDLAQLRPYADLGVEVVQGAGALRAWVDVKRGVLVGASADLALREVDVQIDPKLEPLRLRWVAGRLGTRQLDGGYEVSTQGLEFDTHDGLHWPGGNVRVGLFAADGSKAARGEIMADRLDLAAMAQIANRIPLGEEVHAALGRYAPQGLIEQVKGSWSGPLQAPTQFAVKGRVVNLTLPAATRNDVSTPGFKGLDVDFDFGPTGGKARLAMRDGRIDALGVFDDAAIPFDQLSGDLQWKVEAGHLRVNLPNLRFANADAQGEAQLQWQTDAAGPRFPGVLDLQGSLSRALGTRVHRYLPSVLDPALRAYLRDALVAGTASGVKFRVKGNLRDFPFDDPKLGEFRISANVHNASYAYAPASILPKGSLPWPMLTQLSGELLIDQGVLQIKGARGAVAGGTGLQISKADAVISHLYHDAVLQVNAEAKGPLAEVLGLVNGSPLGAITNKVLAHASASGLADYRLKLGLPLTAVEHPSVQGSVTLAGNELQLSPDTPRLSRLRGVLSFTENGFSVAAVQARALGGDVRIEGGMNGLGAAPGGVGASPASASVLRLQGSASAEGLRQAGELGFVSRLAKYASGSAAYTAVVGQRAGVPELQISSNLVGLALSLPAPLAKAAEVPLVLRLETSAVRSAMSAGAVTQDQLQLDLGRLVNIVYVRDITGPQAQVLRGAIGVGLAADEAAPLPQDGVVANISLAALDLDAWTQVLSQASGTDLSASTLAAQGPDARAGSMGYLPTTMAVRARELVVGGRKLNQVVVGGGREGLLWRANLEATELSGYLEYRQSAGPAAGRVYGRLVRLALGQSTAQEVENLLDEQPATIPALDVVVEDFELRGKKLGRVEIDAVNLGGTGARDVPREWRLNRFNILTPEAVLTASGNWVAINAQSGSAPRRSAKERRRTVLNFKLDMRDAGELLNRFGMTGVVRRGHGRIEGQVAWLGSPLSLDYPSLGGSFNVNVESGQFLKAEPGIAKLLGVLSLQSLPRRLALDFRDVFSEGFSFDFLRGDATIEQGIARTNNLQMKGVNAAVLMEGQADLARETQALKVVVVPEINAGSASLIASAINPLVGLSTFLAQMVLRKPLIEAATQEFFIDGTWVDPRVTKVERRHSPAPAPVASQPEETP